MLIPDKIKPKLIEIITLHIELLNSDILEGHMSAQQDTTLEFIETDLETEDNQKSILKNFAKTILISIGRLGRIEP